MSRILAAAACLFASAWTWSASAQSGAVAQPARPAVGGVEAATVPHTGTPVEDHMNPDGNRAVEEHMNPDGNRAVEEHMNPDGNRAVEDHMNAAGVKSLDEVTRHDATKDVNDLTVPSSEPEPEEDWDTDE